MFCRSEKFTIVFEISEIPLVFEMLTSRGTVEDSSETTIKRHLFDRGALFRLFPSSYWSCLVTTSLLAIGNILLLDWVRENIDEKL